MTPEKEIPTLNWLGRCTRRSNCGAASLAVNRRRTFLLRTTRRWSSDCGLQDISSEGVERHGVDVVVHDFDLEMSAWNFHLYQAAHHFAWGGDQKTVNFLGSADFDLLFHTVFENEAGLEEMRRSDPQKYRDISRLNRFIDGAIRRLMKNEVSQVWFSTYISNMWLTMLAARRIRKLAPEVKVVFSGPGVFDPAIQRFLLANEIVDCCLVGEGEELAVEFLEKHVARGEYVPGLACIREGRYVFEPRPLIPHLDGLPRPDLTGFPWPGGSLKDYLLRDFDGLPVSFSRGCTNHCVFCTEQRIWQRFRLRSPQSVVDDLKFYIREYGVSLFYSCDSMVNFSVKWLTRLCDLIIDEGLELRFTFAFVQGSKLPGALLVKMKRAGFTRLFLGAEHGAGRMLDRMGKETRPEEMKQLVVDAVLAGLTMRIQTIVNFPGETIHDQLDQIAFLRDIDDSLRAQGVHPRQMPQRLLANPFRLEPTTEIYAEPERFGIRIMDIPCARFPSVREAAGVMKRWELVEPHDESLHFQLALRFAFQKDPWRWPPAEYRGIADSFYRLIDENEDRFTLAPGTRLLRDLESGENIAMQYGDRFPMDGRTFDVLGQLRNGKSLCEVQQSLDPSATMDTLKRLAAQLHVRKILVLAKPAP